MPIEKRNNRLRFALLGVSAPAIYLVQLGNPLGGGHSDEPLYIGIAKEMLEKHQWMLPLYHGQAALYKPPLLYWMMIACFKLFGGFSLFAARFPAAFCGALLAVMTALLGSFLFGELTGLLAGWLVVTAIPGTVAYSRAALLDIPLSLAVTTAVYFAARAAKEKNAAWIGCAFIAAGVASLFKGPVGILLAGIPCLWIIMAEKEGKLLIKRPAVFGFLGFLALALLWPLGLLKEGYGRAWFQFFILQENFGKFTSHLDPTTHATPASVLWIHLFSQFLPWGFFLLAAFIMFVIKRDAREKSTWLLVVWILTVILVFTLPEKKLSHYTLPALSACAILTAVLLSRFPTALISRMAFRLTGIIFSITGLLLLFLARVVGGATNVSIILAAAVCFFTGAFFLFRQKLLPAAYAAAAFIFLYMAGLPALTSNLNLQELNQKLDNQPVYVYHRDYALLSTALQHDMNSVSLPEDLENRHGLLILPEEDQADFVGSKINFGPTLLTWTAWKDHIRLLEILHAALSGRQNVLHENILLLPIR